MQENKIKAAVIEEVFRIACFLLYYLFLIGLGLAILVGSCFISYYMVIYVFPAVNTVRGLILAGMIVIGLLLLAVMLGLYLIKPLFAFKKNVDPNRVEVFEIECPELFAMVREVAKNTACKMPKHIYLSPDVNACVFYDTSFWSIFFPVKKNLEIGLGIFDGTNMVNLFIDDESVRKLTLFTESNHNSSYTINVESLEETFEITKHLYEVINTIERNAYRTIYTIAKEVL